MSKIGSPHPADPVGGWLFLLYSWDAVVLPGGSFCHVLIGGKGVEVVLKGGVGNVPEAALDLAKLRHDKSDGSSRFPFGNQRPRRKHILAGRPREQATGKASGAPGVRSRELGCKGKCNRRFLGLAQVTNKVAKGPLDRTTPPFYQTRQLVAGAMGVFGLQAKAGAKLGWLTMAPLARKWPGECGSVRTWLRVLSSRSFSHQFWA